MRHRRNQAIFLVALALLLCLAQAFVWKHSTVRDHSETDKIDTESQHSPTELPGLAGTCLLVIAGVVLSWPHPRTSE